MVPLDVIGFVEPVGRFTKETSDGVELIIILDLKQYDQLRHCPKSLVL